MPAEQAMRAAAALALASVLACANGAPKAPTSGMGGMGVVRCTGDAQCSGGACLGGNCIPRPPVAPGWAMEIRPPSRSNAPITEQADLTGETVPLKLQTDASIDVRVTFNASSVNAIPSLAQVVLTVPSLIGGRPDLTFETGTVANVVTLQTPESVLARSATVDLIPLSPADQQSPPFSFVIDTLAENNNLTIPTNNVWLSGILHDAVDQVPSRPFVARAFQQGRLVSNLSVISGNGASNADGSFRLAIPAATAMNPVTVEIWPQDAAPKDPWFASDDWSLSLLDMGVINLPAYRTPPHRARSRCP
jgi:hypothetical protein